MTVTNTISNLSFTNGINTTSGTGCTNTYQWWQYESWLREITYKPGWSFELRSGSANYPTFNSVGMPGLHLLITAEVIDSNTLEKTLIVHTMPMPVYALESREVFLEAVLYNVHKVEGHETMEFFKASGVRVRNPHPSPTEVLY